MRRSGFYRTMRCCTAIILAAVLLYGCNKAESAPRLALSTASVSTLSAQSIKAPSDATAQALQSVTVYVTESGSKYHCSGCRYLSNSQIAMDFSLAKRSYGPCSRCLPPV